MKKFWLFVLAIVISFLPGIIGVMFSPSGASDVWYNALVKAPIYAQPYEAHSATVFAFICII